MKRLLPGLIAALVVILFGFGISGLAAVNILPNPNFAATYQVDLAGLASRLGLLIGIIVLIAFLAIWAVQSRIERKQAEAQNEQISSQRRFFQRLDHELKNPLTIIRLGIVNLQQSPDLSSEQGHSLERISVQVQRLQKLVIDLRLLYELDASRIERKPVNLRDLMEEAIDLSAQVAEPSRQINLNVQQMPWPVSDILGDRDLLVLVFRNLLDNALKFSAASSSVEVRVTEDGRMASVEIVDTGTGIPVEELAHIFEELYRGENARGVPGSGLGLKLVERIISLHQGDIQVRSKPEMGSVFTIKLPLASETP
ncbi:MAG: HAMP domain-containing histidine kinase [Anaerolineae bacterium]|nr:HAMP domain-containing histidine kinase [Anaerolineae bacterium]